MLAEKLEDTRKGTPKLLTGYLRLKAVSVPLAGFSLQLKIFHR